MNSLSNDCMIPLEHSWLKTASYLQKMRDAMEVLNERLRQPVYNSHVLSSKLSQDRGTLADLERQLLDQHSFTEKRQHDYVLLAQELQVSCF